MITATSLTDHLEEGRRLLAQNGRNLKHIEHRFAVAHHHEWYGPTWLMLYLYDRSVKVGRKVSADRRDQLQIAMTSPVHVLKGYPEDHDFGDCEGCTQFWNNNNKEEAPRHANK